MLLTGASVLIGAILNVVVARQGIHRLSQKSNLEIEANLDEANREYLTNHITDKAQHAHHVLSHAYSDLQIFASIVQDMVDHSAQFAELHERAASLPLFHSKLDYNEK